MSEHKTFCLLGINPKKSDKCRPSECATCGWETSENDRRTEYLEKHGLTKCEDGFRRLIMKKTETEVTE